MDDKSSKKCERIAEEAIDICESMPTTYIKSPQFHPFTSPLEKNTKSLKKYVPGKWNDYFDSQRFIELKDRNLNICLYEVGSGPRVFVFIHGGGCTSLTWALIAKHLKSKCKIIAFDLRGHGHTKGDSTNLDINTLVDDVKALLKTVIEKDMEHVFLIGHSLGGSIAARVANDTGFNFTGCGVIDVVEGTALQSLASMRKMIEKRPVEFDSIERAIEYSVKNQLVRGLESARISIPDQIYKVGEKYRWITDLLASEKYWEGWFLGLSKYFLQARAAKLLILAGTDRLDKELTIAQMQGKYQLLLLQSVGHCVHEDKPALLADNLIQFAERWTKPIPKFNPLTEEEIEALRGTK